MSVALTQHDSNRRDSPTYIVSAWRFSSVFQSEPPLFKPSGIGWSAAEGGHSGLLPCRARGKGEEGLGFSSFATFPLIFKLLDFRLLSLTPFQFALNQPLFP